MSIVILLTLLFSNSVLAQVVAPSLLDCADERRCTSKDLEVVDAYVSGAACVTCTPGQTLTRDLYMRINNKTGSVRTAFALFGTLNNATLNNISGEVMICVGEIPPNTIVEKLVGQITFECGDRVTLTNNFLAWTDAAGTTAQRCDEYKQATRCQDIAPKCGTVSEIVIRTPLTASAATAAEPCIGATTGGSITVTPAGGTPNYKIIICKKTGSSCPATPVTADIVYQNNNATGAVTTPTNLGTGTYCIYVTDATTPTNCTFNFEHTIAGVQCCTNPPKPAICEIRPSACGSTSTVTLRVSNLQANTLYHVKQNGVAVTGSPKNSNTAVNGRLEFTIAAGGGTLDVQGIQTLNNTTCNGTTATCVDLSECTTTLAATTQATPTEEVQTINARLDGAKTKVLAAPNPFSDKVRFTLQSDISGQGSLELYNMMGQKVATVYRGHVEAGRPLNKEYNVPVSRRSNLIYVFKVGDQKVSGKLLNW